ncbi:23S rRNA (guanosine(2251)-2'-O)-methyltransferase RlmB [bacterium]|nr:23S rRNA (guanosine(2251)-2'-O)-methyltransferase RlmB [bacterium]
MVDKISGVHAVFETLIADERKIEKIYLVRGVHKGKLKEIAERASFGGIPVELIDGVKLDRLCGHDHHQGVLAMVRPYHYVDLKDLLSVSINQKTAPFLLVLDQIQDPRNFGAIIRSAEGAGVDGLIITTRRTSPLSATVVKTSAGASEHMRICKVMNLVNTLEYLKTLGIWIIGADVSASQPLYDLDGREALALVIGSEGRGLRPLVARTCDWTVNIPMFGRVQSLNASVSAAIVLYEIRRQRNFPGPGSIRQIRPGSNTQAET